ncbi:MAG TPA: hypothetical protein VMN36_07815 [Verrucomicrobiales bacterium]|nr:hypothetical protein [Verrucomicrobiales bacterium]
MEAAASTPHPALRDFPDRLSPMLVKELRQGMRTKMFTAAFIVVQAVMILIAFFSAIAAGAGMRAEGLSGVFWGMLVFVLIFVMPLRAFGVLSNEMRDDTMETILLTRLSAWRIVFGKWLALVTQTTLLLSAILPYVVLRYWLGGINLAVEMFWLGVIWLVSCLMTAILAGLSGQRLFLLRGALALGLLVSAFAFCMMVMQLFIFGHMHDPIPHTGEPAAWAYYLDWGILIVFGIYYFLDFGASQIAPESANLSVRKRLSALVATAMVLLSGLAGVGEEFYLSLSFLIMAVAVVDALTEPATFVPSVYRRFLNCGWPGRLALMVFGPGWPYGFFFFLCCAGLGVWGWISAQTLVGGGRIDERDWLLLVSLIGTLIWPVAWIRLFNQKAERTFAHYVVIQIVVCLFAMLLLFLDAAVEIHGVLWVGVFLPFVGFFFADRYHDLGGEALLVISVATGLCIVVVGVAALRHMLRVRRLLALRGTAPQMASANETLAPGTSSPEL